MILVLSNGRDVTADYFEQRLIDTRVPHVRVDTEHLPRLPLTFTVGGPPGRKSASGCLALAGRCIGLDAITSVYYRRPVAPEFPAEIPDGLRDWMESEVRRAWGGALTARQGVLWVNHPLAISAANYKPEQLARAERFGWRVPETIITNDPAAAQAFCERHEWFVVVKPVSHGEILGESEDDDRIVYTNLITQTAARHLERVAVCPTLFQQALTKDVDLRVTVVGDEVIAVALHSQEAEVSRVDCRRDNMAGMRYSLAALPDSLSTRLVSLVRSYGLQFAAVDLVRDVDGAYWFLEINPAGQWAWLEQLAGAPISAALIRTLVRAQ